MMSETQDRYVSLGLQLPLPRLWAGTVDANEMNTPRDAKT